MIHTLFTRLLRIVLAAIAVLTIASCTERKFRVEGTITQAKDSILYFENMSLNGPVVVDSAKLDEKGDFSFSDVVPTAPEFYRLRIAGQIIHIAVNDTLEHIRIKASYPTMTTEYAIEGSYDCAKIKELALMQQQLQRRLLAIDRNPALGVEATADSMSRIIEAYKDDVKRRYIFKEPMRPYAYFALFQALGNRLIFNPRESKDDIKAFAAVATSWDTYYPEAERGKNLHNIAIEGMKDLRIVQNRQAVQQVDMNKMGESGIIDIALYDNKGHLRHLTDCKGKVVLLDFHIFATKASTDRIMMLRDLYNKYHARGFEIYQVSLDPNEHFWKTQVAALPWISVHDDNGLSSQYAATYNLQRVPTYFLIDRNNVLQKRDVQIKDLHAAIESML